MMRRRWLLSVCLLLLATASAIPASALTEADRLWLVGEKAYADALYPLARRVLERFVAEATSDPRLPEAVLLLGKARLAVGDTEPAMEAFRRAQSFMPPPGRPFEPKFWEAEALFRMKRFGEARAIYDEIIRTDAASPLAPPALYGFAWSELELRQPEAAVTSFREFLKTWPDHALAPSATFQMARGLVELRRFGEAVPVLQSFVSKYPGHKLVPDARYLIGMARVNSGDSRGGLADLRAFVEANPGHDLTSSARRLVTETVSRFGDKEELQDNYKALLEQTTPSPEALADAAGIAGRLGRTKDQEAAWRRLVKEFPDSPAGRRAALDLGGLTFKRSQWKDTVGFAQNAAQSDDDGVKAEAWLLAGEAELKLKRFAPAAKAFESTLAVANVEAAVRYRALAGLGLAREELRDFKAALTAYESVASKSPDAALRDWARERAKAVKARQSSSPPAKPKAGS
jgi:TolA-binding protein